MKDTLRNCEDTQEFVVNIVSEDLAERMNLSSGELPYEEDEFLFAKVDAVPSEVVEPPRVAGAKVAYECVLNQIVHVGGAKDGAGSLVIGTVIRIHVSDDVWTGERIDTNALAAIGRYAGNEYTTTRERFTMVRPTVQRS